MFIIFKVVSENINGKQGENSCLKVRLCSIKAGEDIVERNSNPALVGMQTSTMIAEDSLEFAIRSENRSTT